MVRGDSGRKVLVKDESSREAMMKNQSIRSLHTEGLPLGWEQRVTEGGRVYYVDHNAKETHWTLPESVTKQDSFTKKRTKNEKYENEV